MTDLEKPKTKPRAKKKPPTQTAGVNGIDGHGGMGEAPPEQAIPNNAYIDWFKLVDLPAFQMFVFEESSHPVGIEATAWVHARREGMSNEVFYKKYSEWHKNKGLWLNESPTGDLL